ncbi:conserved hypothetical protein [Xanthomonas phaseoli pv. phaseoli]|nr:conserved hypothetical protein [Xanthomonas phaseoli pv. phaseoli]
MVDLAPSSRRHSRSAIGRADTMTAPPCSSIGASTVTISRDDNVGCFAQPVAAMSKQAIAKTAQPIRYLPIVSLPQRCTSAWPLHAALRLYTFLRIDRVAARLARVARSCRMMACCCPPAASIWRRMHCVAPAPSRRCGRGASQVTLGAWLAVGRPAQPLVALGFVAESRLDLATARPRAGHARADARAFRVIGLADLAWATRQTLPATCSIEAPDQSIAGVGSGSLHCRRASHDDTHVAFGDRLGRQGCAGPTDRQFGLGRRPPGAGGQHDDHHEPRPGQTHDGLRKDRSAARPRAASLAAGSPSCVASRQT